MLPNIFNYLDVKDLVSASKVSKTWREAAQFKRLWREKTVEIRNGCRFSPQMLSLLQEIGIQYLKLPAIKEGWLSHLMRRKDHKRNVKYLQRVINYLSHSLRTLDLSQIHLGEAEVQAAFTLKMDNLQELVLNPRIAFNGVIAEILGALCPNLEVLGLGSTVLAVNQVSPVVDKMPKLRTLNCVFGQDFMDSSALLISQILPHQREITLDDSPMTIRGIHHLAGLRNLMTLNICRCYNLSENFIDVLSQAQSRVRILRVCDCAFMVDNILMHHIGRSSLNIQFLTLLDNFYGSDEGLTHLVQKHPSPLRGISLEGDAMTVHGLRTLNEKCPKLELVILDEKEVNIPLSLDNQTIVFKA